LQHSPAWNNRDVGDLK
jgi:hypothetical protein